MGDAIVLDLLMITYNRPDYTRRTMERLFETIDQRVRVWVWHNGEDQETLDVVKSFQDRATFHHLEVSRENRRLRIPTIWFWERSEAPYVSKLDDDCLLSPGWFDKLLDAHERNPDLGVLGCWRYYDDDFIPEVAGRKIRELEGDHQIFINPWIEGTGYMMKRAMQQQLGELRMKESFPSYCIRGAMNGWQIGWRYPFIHQEHMDDPRSDFFGIRNQEDFERHKPLSAINHGVKTLDEWKARVRHMAHVVQAASPNPWFYCGWRMKVRNILKRIKTAVGIKEPWRKA